MVGVARLGAARASLIATIEPVLTLTWAVLILSETLVALQVLGAVLVLAGVVWTQAMATDGDRGSPRTERIRSRAPLPARR